MVSYHHITSRPLAYLYNLLSMGKVESILSSSITAVFFTAFLISALMWYGSAHTTQELTYSMEESQIQVYFSGGCLNGTEYSTPSLVKAYARKAQFGQIFTI